MTRKCDFKMKSQNDKCDFTMKSHTDKVTSQRRVKGINVTSQLESKEMNREVCLVQKLETDIFIALQLYTKYIQLMAFSRFLRSVSR